MRRRTLLHPERAIAVLGQGLGGRLTGRQSRLIELICESGGLILSDFCRAILPPDILFLQRNRIIAGLAVGTVVVEATPVPVVSSLRDTRSVGREVMAVPGHPGPHVRGLQPTHPRRRLLGDGAETSSIPWPSHRLRGRPLSPLVPHQQAVLRALQTGDTVDHIAVMSGLDVSDPRRHR